MSDLHSLYLALKTIMKTSAPQMKAAKDTMAEFTVNVPQDIMASKDPVWFGSVRLAANHVAYYLPPLIAKEGRDIAIPDSLKAKATTKTCFTFNIHDPDLMAQLAEVTKKAAEAYGVPVK